MALVIIFLKAVISLWLDISFYLILGLFLAGILHLFIRQEFISKHLGKNYLFSIIKATILGIPLPVCSCGVIPVASSLKKNGASIPSVLAFLISAPTTGVDSILATYSLMGPLFAVFRPLAAAIAGIFCGFLAYLALKEKEKNPVLCRHKRISFQAKIKNMFNYAFYEIPQDIGKWLFWGVFLGGFLSVVIPSGFLRQYFTFPIDFAVSLLISIPIYVCATGSIPIAVSLIHKGFSPGAALVFLIAGPATNTITLSFVRAKLGKKPFYLYLASIIFVAVASGLVFNFIWAIFGSRENLIMGAGRLLPQQLKLFSGLALFFVVVNSLARKKRRISNPDLEFYVPGIHCRNCKNTIEQNLSGVLGIKEIEVSLGEKKLRIKGEIRNREAIAKKLKDIGYPPKE